MDPIESWVDTRELRRMADALLASPPDPEETAFGADFVGYEVVDSPSSRPGSQQPDTPGEENACRTLAAARELAQRGGMLEPQADSHGELGEAAELTQVTPVAAAGVSPSSPAVPRFIPGLESFGPWLREVVQARSFFLLDRGGGVLIDEVRSSKLRQVARTLAQACYTANRQAGTVAAGNLHIKVAPDFVLEVVPVNTRHGPLILGIIVPHPLNSGHVEVVARGLQQVVDAGSQS